MSAALPLGEAAAGGVPRLLLAGLLSAVLLAAGAWWLRRSWRQTPPAWRRWLAPALAWRLLLTAVNIRYPSIDAGHATDDAQALLAQFWARPGRAWSLLAEPRLYNATGGSWELYAWSPALFYDKLLAGLGLATAGERWATTLVLSLVCFGAAWALVRALARTWPGAWPGAAGLVFLGWPTVVWYTSGLNKETVFMAATFGVVALALPLLYGPPAARPTGWALAGQLLALLVLAGVLMRMRYFFALPLLGGLLALAGMQAATRRGWLPARGPAQVGALAALLLAGLLAAWALGGRRMEVDYFVHEINLNYWYGQRTSIGRPHLVYAHWLPTAGRLLAHAPLAAAYTLTRPWPNELAGWLYAGVALENLLLLVLLGRALLAVARGRRAPLPAALVALLLGYCLLLAAFIGLSTPNLGTLHRYRIVLLPWLLWLALSVGDESNRSTERTE